METAETIVRKFIKILKAQNGVSYPVFPFSKPTAITPNEYAVVNSLAVSQYPLQNCLVNVNYYFKDITDGAINLTQFETASAQIIGLLDYYTDNQNRFYISFKSQNVEPDPRTGQHYANCKFLIHSINIQ